MKQRAAVAVVWMVCLVASTRPIPSTAGDGKKLATVPPADEILVVSPQVDPEGKPRPVFQTDATTGMLQVDVPPTVLVHRYYYTGDRTFQGPMLPGGPTVLVLNHPKTGEQLMVRAQLLPGAPRISYKRHSIEYDYGRSKIVLEFGFFKKGQPKVVIKGCGDADVNLVGETSSKSGALGLASFFSPAGDGPTKKSQASANGITAEFENTLPTVR